MDGLQWKTLLYNMDDLGVPLFSETFITYNRTSYQWNFHCHVRLPERFVSSFVHHIKNPRHFHARRHPGRPKGR